jgi:hypothetical protein
MFKIYNFSGNQNQRFLKPLKIVFLERKKLLNQKHIKQDLYVLHFFMKI